MPPCPASIVYIERIERITVPCPAGTGRRSCCSAGLPAVRKVFGRRAASLRQQETRSSPRRPARLEHRAGLPVYPRLGFYAEQAVGTAQGCQPSCWPGCTASRDRLRISGQRASSVPAEAAMVTLAARTKTPPARSLTWPRSSRPARPRKWRPLRVRRCHPGRSPCSRGHRYWERSCRKTPLSSMSHRLRGGGPCHDRRHPAPHLLSLTATRWEGGCPWRQAPRCAAPDRPVILLDGDNPRCTRSPPCGHTPASI